MTMQLKHLKNLILVNRRILAEMYDHKQSYKEFKKEADEKGNIAFEFLAHNQLKRLTKDIARMVTLQQALKLEVQCRIQRERESREIMKKYNSGN